MIEVINVKKSDLKAIIINLISSTIFQLAIIFLSGSGFLYVINKLVKSLKHNNITITIYTLLLLVFSCITVTAFIIILLLKLIKHRKIKTNNHDFDNIDDYYFSNYEKHLTIYKNGNGIIIHKFTVIINNTEKFKRIRRKLNIEDGKTMSNFPSIKTMMNTSKSERFDKFGFWYYTKDNIISDVKEYYWLKNSSGENKEAKNNPKEMRWIFQIDKQRIEPNHPYDIIYAISVPGLAPLSDGKLDCSLTQNECDINSSAMNIDHKIKKLKYTISFEKEVELDSVPICKYIIEGQDEPNESIIKGNQEDDMFYNKYVFNIINPEFNSHLKIVWKYTKIMTV